MRKFLGGLVIAAFLYCLTIPGSETLAAKRPRPTPTPIPTATPKPTATPVPTATPRPTATPVPTPTIPPGRPDASIYQVGDIFTMGQSPDLWNHDAIFVGVRTWVEGGVVNSGPAFVESTSAGVNYTLVSEYFDDPHVAIQRLNSSVANRQELINQAVAYAEAKLGTPYDFFFNKYNDSRLYCSELIWHGYYYGTYSLDLDTNGGSMVTPADIYQNPNLTLVYKD